MELLKKVNNNYCIARDNSGNQVIVSGKGIGFIKMPCILDDLSIIDRTFYDIDDRIYSLISTIPEEILNLSLKSVDYASSKLGKKLNTNFGFTLADHINFAIKRLKNGIEMNYGITYEMEYLHGEEVNISKNIVRVLNKQLGMNFPISEVAIIAMHILEAENSNDLYKKSSDFDDMVKDIVEIVISDLNVTVDKDSFNYYRFVTHLQYLVERVHQNRKISSENIKLYEDLKNQFPMIYECVQNVKKYLEKTEKNKISDEEVMYLMIHINRLCSKEDCNS